METYRGGCLLAQVEHSLTSLTTSGFAPGYLSWERKKGVKSGQRTDKDLLPHQDTSPYLSQIHLQASVPENYYTGLLEKGWLPPTPKGETLNVPHVPPLKLVRIVKHFCYLLQKSEVLRNSYLICTS